jgi:hypothetical protein
MVVGLNAFPVGIGRLLRDDRREGDSFGRVIRRGFQAPSGQRADTPAGRLCWTVAIPLVG